MNDKVLDPSFVLTRFLGVYKRNLAFESTKMTIAPAILDSGSIAERQTGSSELSVKQNTKLFAKITTTMVSKLNVNLHIAYHNIVQLVLE